MFDYSVLPESVVMCLAFCDDSFSKPTCNCYWNIIKKKRTRAIRIGWYVTHEN